MYRNWEIQIYTNNDENSACQSPCITLLADGAAGEAGEVLTQGYVKNGKPKAVLGGAHMSHILSGIAIYLASQDSGGGKPAQREY